ncbi:hypothetical protein CRG98_008898 [Punica granatum]|uniref:Uncharacterized protein n=1 Tax=Punica granatum TaxID=22663 RepID=A0A2I0KQ87_PUNGR|nr:hypothetical protein CRG98_008898 [Punica granatum]
MTPPKHTVDQNSSHRVEDKGLLTQVLSFKSRFDPLTSPLEDEVRYQLGYNIGAKIALAIHWIPCYSRASTDRERIALRSASEPSPSTSQATQSHARLVEPKRTFPCGRDIVCISSDHHAPDRLLSKETQPPTSPSDLKD